MAINRLLARAARPIRLVPLAVLAMAAAAPAGTVSFKTGTYSASKSRYEEGGFRFQLGSGAFTSTAGSGQLSWTANSSVTMSLVAGGKFDFSQFTLMTGGKSGSVIINGTTYQNAGAYSLPLKAITAAVFKPGASIYQQINIKFSYCTVTPAPAAPNVVAAPLPGPVWAGVASMGLCGVGRRFRRRKADKLRAGTTR